MSAISAPQPRQTRPHTPPREPRPPAHRQGQSSCLVPESIQALSTGRQTIDKVAQRVDGSDRVRCKEVRAGVLAHPVLVVPKHVLDRPLFGLPDERCQRPWLTVGSLRFRYLIGEIGQITEHATNCLVIEIGADERIKSVESDVGRRPPLAA